MNEERFGDLPREVSQTVSLAVVTTNCEKSAETVVGMTLKWAMPKG